MTDDLRTRIAEILVHTVSVDYPTWKEALSLADTIILELGTAGYTIVSRDDCPCACAHCLAGDHPASCKCRDSDMFMTMFGSHVPTPPCPQDDWDF